MRATKPTKARLPRRARAISYKAKGDEKLWRCWNCGFICNEDQNDSSELPAGDSHMVYSSPATGGAGKWGMIIPTEVGKECVLMEQSPRGYTEVAEYKSIIIPTEVGKECVLMELDSLNGNKVIEHTYSSIVTRGCPFCGSTNYKG